MSGHSHSHSHFSDSKRLGWMLVLSSLYMVAEIIGGILSGSLALLADAGHMAGDVAAMALGMSAIWISKRPPDDKKTYGYYRAEILAALINAASLVFISGWILYEAYERFGQPPEVQGATMTLVAAGGLIVNLIGLAVMTGGSKDSLNIRGVWLHVLTDTLGSASALIAGFLVWKFGWNLADPIISVAIGLLILVGSWSLLKRSVDVLLVGVPEGIHMESLREDVLRVDGVEEVHDLHVWSIRTGVNALSAHVKVSDERDGLEILKRLIEMAIDKHGISHPTFQLEPPGFEHRSSFCPLTPVDH